MVIKDRSAHNRGELHGMSVFTNEDVISIRERYALGGITHQELADEYGVKRRSIGKIVNRERWKHI
jgi:hypothetical protein